MGTIWPWVEYAHHWCGVTAKYGTEVASQAAHRAAERHSRSNITRTQDTLYRVGFANMTNF